MSVPPTHSTDSSFSFSLPPKAPGLTRKQHQQVKRAAKLRKARAAAKKFSEVSAPVSFEDMQKLLADGYSWASTRAVMAESQLEVRDVQTMVEIRFLRPDEPIPEITGLLEQKKVDEAKAAIPYSVGEVRTYVAWWEEFGCITQEQLSIMERIIVVKNVLRDVSYTLD
ncbi:hypothetical protein PHYPSEUDO_007032 [Phytophthora pseudosyringae]|uniref:Uncharacterized protein n=1 Tax=Phytophthora pseudosyringae TaxID=221518 RepID=A0A8T1VH51_9STRA|nr:hypothetical protein PHYPSEUDO_007032 [Phytophthora pseudosyringae]